MHRCRPACKGWSRIASIVREAAASLPILAALLFAGSLWLFGLPPLRQDRALIYQRGGTPELGSLEEARLAASLDRPLPRESVIRIRWSRDRD